MASTIAETKIKKSIKHDNMSIAAHFPSGAFFKFSIGRNGEKLDIRFSNIQSELNEQGRRFLKWIEYREKETNIDRFDRIEKACQLARSGSEFMKVIEKI